VNTQKTELSGAAKKTGGSILRSIVKYFIVPVLVIAIAWASYFLLYGNFHKVDADFYRSAQLFEHNMPYYIQKYGIKSILNLRGDSSRQWYLDELRISKEYHVEHYDYGIGDREVTSMEAMDDIVAIVQNAPKPLLVHCKAGADRASLASALYLYAVKQDWFIARLELIVHR